MIFPAPSLIASGREVGIRQGMMTFDLDREVSAGIAVDLTLHQSEVAMVPRAEADGQLTSPCEYSPRYQREGLITSIGQIGIN